MPLPMFPASSGFGGQISYGRLAQLVEHLTFNQRVVGSIPAAPTKEIKGLGYIGLNFFFPGKR